MSGDFKVNFGALETAAADIQNSGKGLQARLDELDRQLAPLRSDWTGAASESYLQAKTKWSRSIQEMNEVLGSIGQAVTQSGSGYQGAEKNNSNLFG